jgi:8-oxo-dGTP diphosphatase
MFNIRVYGIYINSKKQVLVSDEIIRGLAYTKFCGGGMEFGEGTIDCLKREFKEEMNLQIDVGEHLYTTSFFQQSAFNPSHQIISIYYYIHPLEDVEQKIIENQKNYKSDVHHNSEIFRLMEWDDFSSESLSLPIDKIVANLLKQKH